MIREKERHNGVKLLSCQQIVIFTLLGLGQNMSSLIQTTTFSFNRSDRV